MHTRSYLFILLFVCATVASAQKSEPIYSFVKVMKPAAYYHTQSDLWKKEIDKDKANAYAWYNYYRANRNLLRVDQSDTRSQEEKAKAEKRIVEEMGKAVPGSYEYNLCRWLISGNNEDDLGYLKRAAELGKDRTEHISDMIVWGEVERDLNKKNENARKWLESGEMSPGLLYYNYNVIQGLDPNAILVTQGDNDTYPVWLLQSKGIRTDVTVLNTSLLLKDKYRSTIFKELGIPDMELKLKGGSEKELGNFQAEIIRHIASNKNHYPVYAALTVGKEYTQKQQENLYLTGLAYEYSTAAIDNLAVLKRNFEQRYALDYIDKYFVSDVSEYWVKLVNGNYVVPMIRLYEHYNLSGETQKAERLKQLIITIAKASGQENDIMDYFKNN